MCHYTKHYVHNRSILFESANYSDNLYDWGIVCVCSRIVGGEPFNQNMRPAARQPLSSQMPLMPDVAAAMDAHRKCQIIQATGAIAFHNLARPTGLYNALELKAYLKQVCMVFFALHRALCFIVASISSQTLCIQNVGVFMAYEDTLSFVDVRRKALQQECQQL